MAINEAQSLFIRLPEELLFQFAELLDVRSKCRAMKADKTLRRILRDGRLWLDFIVEDGTQMTQDEARPFLRKMNDAIHYVSLGDNSMLELDAPYILGRLLQRNHDFIEDMRLSLYYDASISRGYLQDMDNLHTLVLDMADGLICYLDEDEDFSMPSSLKHLEVTTDVPGDCEILRAKGLKTLILRATRDADERRDELPAVSENTCRLMLWGDEPFADNLETRHIAGFPTKVGMAEQCDMWMFEALTTLRLINCYLDSQGWFPPALKTLIIINCVVCDDTIEAFEQSLWPNIREIHIENSGLDLYSIERSLYIPPEEQTVRTLKDLTLILEPSDPADVDQQSPESYAMDIESLMEVYGDSLETLSLTFADSLGNADLKAIGKHCKSLHTLRYLSPSGATFEGIIELLQGVADQLKDLWVVTSALSYETAGTVTRLKELCKSRQVNAWIRDVNEEEWVDVASL